METAVASVASETEIFVQAEQGSPFDGIAGHDLSRALTDVARERERQWGLGCDAVHDDAHSNEELAEHLHSLALDACQMATIDDGAFREDLVQVAAMAVAVVEALDRRVALANGDRLRAWAFASGQIEFGANLPEGALPIAYGMPTPVRSAVEIHARHAHDGKTLLVPGVPEAADGCVAVDALKAFVARVARTMERLEGEEDEA